MKLISGVQEFTFEPDVIVKIVGVGAVYTYQATGGGSTAVFGCNDLELTEWVFILSMEAGDSACVMHSWRFLKSTGAAVIVCSRGSR